MRAPTVLSGDTRSDIALESVAAFERPDRTLMTVQPRELRPAAAYELGGEGTVDAEASVARTAAGAP